MSIEYSIHPEHNVVVTRCRGDIDGDDYLTVYREIYADPDHVVGMNEVVDLRGADIEGVLTSHVRHVAALTAAAYEEDPSERRPLFRL